ncbi:hypothetical protein KGF54_000884 [Candida jiufengensis]|uniref:uncharacterized protein n=1 Tax=Candida jiufengensis TaxID=497108 RepID=UPI00222417FE|nr:uncharacterized protein KGF54_000884 [Candida jiufengensis]KAI5956409.1 hypothetical protein KGF54_000884 [Candida jiufengensis]
MIRQSIRRIHNSLKDIPYEPIPKNKYNSKRSGFNFKPKTQEGLVYNPPAAIIKPSMQTPYIFLPPNDPRRELAKQQKISHDIILDMPIIRQFKASNEREYNITSETIEKIKALRSEDPQKWNFKELSKKFNIELPKLVYFFKTELSKQKKFKNEINVPKFITDRQKRKQMWMRNEY